MWHQLAVAAAIGSVLSVVIEGLIATFVPLYHDGSVGARTLWDQSDGSVLAAVFVAAFVAASVVLVLSALTTPGRHAYSTAIGAAALIALLAVGLTLLTVGWLLLPTVALLLLCWAAAHAAARP